MKKRIMAFGLATLMALGMAGCTAKGTPATTPVASTEADSATPAPEAPEASNEPVSLRYATWDVQTAIYLQEAIKTFNENSSNIKVEAMEISSNDYNDKLATMLAGGEDVDIFDIKEILLYPDYIKKGQLEVLDSYISNNGFDMSGYGGVDKALDKDGSIYALPYRGDIEVLYYNKDIFDAANEPYPTDDMTLEQVREVAQRLTKGTGSDKVYGYLTHTWTSQVYDYAVAAGLDMAGGNYDALLPVYKTILAMQNEDKSTIPFGELKTANLHYSGAFGSNANVAMMEMGTWYISRLISENDSGLIHVNWGVAKMPHLEGVPKGHVAGGITPLGINTKSQNKDAAWEFVSFLAGEDGAKLLAGYGTRPAYQSAEVVNIYTSAEGFPQECKDALETANINLQFPPSELGAPIKALTDEDHELIMIGEMTPEEGVADMNKRAQEVINGAR